jgi:hypothetical protein
MSNSKRVLLHIGYPKTATTTLQEDVFLQLHNLGMINYLGRTITSSHTAPGRPVFTGEDWAIKFRRHIAYDEPLLFDEGNLSSTKLNVISDEGLTFHQFFNKIRFDVDKNLFDMPMIIKSALGQDVDVSVLITLRNQADLIHSCFVQQYRFVYRYLGGMTFATFLGNGAAGIDMDFLDIFNFDALVNSYVEAFGPHINLLLFEDLINDKENFWAEFGELLDVDAKTLMDLTGMNHRRKRSHQSGGIQLKVLDPSITGRCCQLVAGKKRFDKWFDRRHYLRSTRLLRMEKKILYKIGRIKLPYITAGERDLIKESFAERNRRFASAWSLDPEKMKRYGYI